MTGRPKSHVFRSVLGGFIETFDGFMSHVENSSSWGDGGSCRTGPLDTLYVTCAEAKKAAHTADGR